MNVTERLQTLVETANEILSVYHQNMGNKIISLQLRNTMGDNIIILENMVSDANNLALFDQNDPEIEKMNEELFVLFNDCVMKNIKIFNHLFVDA
jgi:hypothetical protein